jgi:hypothetical protein
MINPMRGTGVDQVLLTRILNVISHYATIYEGHVDGIMHDYTSGRPWAYPAGDESFEGIIDLDRDGVAFDEDPEEQAAWRGWQYALADQLQERFGEGFIQIANGRLPLDDREMARRMAGVIIQKFPRTVWNLPAQAGLDYAIQMREPGWLTPRRGHHWIYYWAATFEDDGMLDFRRWASFLRIDLGAPVGALTITRNGELSVYAREFEGGTVSIDFNELGNATAMGVEPR